MPGSTQQAEAVLDQKLKATGTDSAPALAELARLGRDGSMSYVIQVWEQPVPATLEEAEAILDRLLAAGPGEPSEKLDQLVETLWARYPSDLDGDEDDPVWEDSFPRDGREPLKVETLAIGTSHLDEVVPFVAKTATELGLVAYDPQYGTVYLQGGRTLGRTPPSSGKAAPAAPAATDRGPVPLDVDKATSRLLAALDPFMATHGFAWKRLSTGDGWVRLFPGGQQKIVPLVDGRGSSVGLTLLFSATLGALDQPVNRFKQSARPAPVEVLSGSLYHYLTAAGHSGTGLFQPRGTTMIIPANTDVRVDTAVAALKDIILGIVAEMQGFSSVAGVWQNALDEARGHRKSHFNESMPAKLVAGKLLGAAELDEVADAELARYDAALARRREGASPAMLEMLAREARDFKEARARLRDFLRTQVEGKGGRSL